MSEVVIDHCEWFHTGECFPNPKIRQKCFSFDAMVCIIVNCLLCSFVVLFGIIVFFAYGICANTLQLDTIGISMTVQRCCISIIIATKILISHIIAINYVNLMILVSFAIMRSDLLIHVLIVNFKVIDANLHSNQNIYTDCLMIFDSGSLCFTYLMSECKEYRI